MGLKNKREAATETGSVSDALLLATMYVVGSSVDVHIKDGSIYSGTFHTASVDGQYDVVLKEARLIKKGKCRANVTSGSVIQTLVIHSSDLVQIVAKGVSLPADVLPTRASSDSGKAIKDESTLPDTALSDSKSSINSCSNSDSKNSVNDCCNRPRSNQNRRKIKEKIGHISREIPAEEESSNYGKNLSNYVECVKDQKMITMETEQVSLAAANGRYSRGSRCKDNKDCQSKPDRSTMKRVGEGQSSSRGEENWTTDVIEDQFSDGSSSLSSLDTARSTVPPVSDSTANASLESQSSTSSISCNSASVGSRKNSKEYKLNPEAKVFVPYSSCVAATTLGVSSCSNMTHGSGSTAMLPLAASQTAVGTSPFAPRTPLPAKVNEHTGSRMPSLRYGGQYHALHPTSYTPPNSAVMVGRLGQLVYIQPVTHDSVNNNVAIPSVSTGPFFSSSPTQYPKPQGMLAAQNMPIYLPSSPYIGVTQQQPFLIPTNFPVIPPASRLVPVQSHALGLKLA